jgi:hypothetical protein
MSNFTKDDFDLTQKFASFILNKMVAKDVSAKDMFDFNKLVIDYNALCRKIEANIMEVKAIHPPAPEEPKERKTRASKSASANS